MAKKITTISNLPQSENTAFETGQFPNGLSEKAEIAPNEFVFFEKGNEPTTRIEKGSHYIEYGLECPFKVSCSNVIGDNEKPTPYICKKTCDMLEITVEAKHYFLEEIITLKEKPGNNEFTLLVDSNLDYELMQPIEDLLDPELGPIDTPNILGYHGCRWKSGDDIIYYWGVLRIEDSAGSVTFAMYQPPAEGKNIRFTIGQQWLDNAIYPIEIKS